MFLPPQPLFTFPQDLDDDRDVIPQLCSDVYFKHEIASICVTYEGVPKHTVIFFHGNNDNLPKLIGYAKRLSAELKSDVYVMEYPGYSTGRGPPTEAGCYASASKFAAAVKDAARAPVVVMGYSMGCAPALHAACEVKAAAVLLVAPFVSALAVGLRLSEWQLPWSAALAPIDVFCTLPMARKLPCPLLVMHGTRDNVVPLEHGTRVRLAAKDSEFYPLLEASHTSSLHSHSMFDNARSFLGTHSRLP
jgi:hypothetical protein